MPANQELTGESLMQIGRRSPAWLLHLSSNLHFLRRKYADAQSIWRRDNDDRDVLATAALLLATGRLAPPGETANLSRGRVRCRGRLNSPTAFCAPVRVAHIDAALWIGSRILIAFQAGTTAAWVYGFPHGTPNR